MGFLGESGVTALWNKVRANFGNKLTVNGTTVTLQNGAATPTNLSQITIPDATASAAGAMSAADKSKLDGIATGANKYSHPTSSGNKHIPSGGSSGQILRWSADGTAAWGADTDTTYDAATTSAAGLMSAADKSKLDGIATGANKYEHPVIHSVDQTGVHFYKIALNTGGHVKLISEVKKADITALGIPAQDTTYSAATTSAAGLMSAADKTKLDGIAAGANNYELPNIHQSVKSTMGLQSIEIDLKGRVIGWRTTEKWEITNLGIPSTDDMNAAIAAAQVGAAKYQGAVSSNDTISGSSYKAGWYWVVSKAGTYVGETCEVGDMIFANTDKGSAYSAAHFDVVQNNIVEMTASEVEAVCTL